MIGKKIMRILCLTSILSTGLVNVYAQETNTDLHVKNLKCKSFKNYIVLDEANNNCDTIIKATALGILFTSLVNVYAQEADTDLHVKNIDCELFEFYHTLDEVENHSDTIVKATVLGEHENFEKYPGGLGYTKTKVEVSDVYKGHLNKNDIITIRESFFDRINKETGEKYRVSYNLYEPCTEGKEYIFFLNKDDKDIYHIVNLIYGKYPLIELDERNVSGVNDLTNEELNLGEGKFTTYKNIFIEVMKKYN